MCKADTHPCDAKGLPHIWSPEGPEGIPHCHLCGAKGPRLPIFTRPTKDSPVDVIDKPSPEPTKIDEHRPVIDEIDEVLTEPEVQTRWDRIRSWWKRGGKGNA